MIQKYFDEISQDSGKYCFGVADTLHGLELGAVDTLIVWENLDVTRFTLKNPSSGEISVIHLIKDQEKQREFFVDSETNTDLEIVEKISLLEWVSLVLSNLV